MAKRESSAYEVLSVIVPTFLLIFNVTSIYTVFHGYIKNNATKYLLDMIFVVVPIILNITILVPYMVDVFIFNVVISMALLLASRCYRHTKTSPVDEPLSEKKDFVTNARSTINLITAIAILAVDFKIFPKQFHKTFKYGYSLMDVGVGLFVFANGIVAPEVRGYKHTLLKTLKDSMPLIVLGVGRYLAVTLIGYDVSVTEYGVHWNFFITLAITKIFGTCFLNLIHAKYSIIGGLLLLCVHELLLQMGLANYVFSDVNREDLINANREGIVSSLGFVSLYFLSVQFGLLLNLKEKNSSNRKLTVKLVSCTVILFAATFYWKSHFNMSRRLANSVYCLWTLSIGVFMTTLFFFSELFQKYLYTKYNYKRIFSVPFVMDAINFNGLTYFLIANVLTGLVNIVFETLLISTFWSIVILIIYINLVCLVISLLFIKNVKLKL